MPADRFSPVTNEMLTSPPAEDWLMWRRTYDAWAHSPLDQIDRSNVGNLRLAWVWTMEEGKQETTPLVHGGMMFLVQACDFVEAVDAATGDLIWRYERETGGKAPMGLVMSTSAKSLAIYRDLVYFTSPDAYLVALDARTGTVRWRATGPEPGHGYLGRRTGASTVYAPTGLHTARTSTGRPSADSSRCTRPST